MDHELTIIRPCGDSLTIKHETSVFCTKGTLYVSTGGSTLKDAKKDARVLLKQIKRYEKA